MGRPYFLSNDDPLQFIVQSEDGTEEVIVPSDFTCSGGHTVKYVEVDGVKDQVQCNYGEGRDYCDACLAFFA
jgi:hypothetical protein